MHRRSALAESQKYTARRQGRDLSLTPQIADT